MAELGDRIPFNAPENVSAWLRVRDAVSYDNRKLQQLVTSAATVSLWWAAASGGYHYYLQLTGRGSADFVRTCRVMILGITSYALV